MCDEARDEAVRAATEITPEHEEDELTKHLRAAIADEGRPGNAYEALFEMLNNARGRGANGGIVGAGSDAAAPWRSLSRRCTSASRSARRAAAAASSPAAGGAASAAAVLATALASRAA